jgi:hypothetical protein
MRRTVANCSSALSSSRMEQYPSDLSKGRCCATEAATLRLPRILRPAKLTDQETDVFQWLVVLQGCQSNAVRCQMIEEDA